MDIKQLQAMGAFVPASQVFKRDIPVKVPPLKPESEWADAAIPEPDLDGKFEEKTLTFHIRKRSAVDFYELTTSEDRKKPFVAILRCVCDEKGQQVFPALDVVERLSPWLWMPLAKEVFQVNEYEVKNSRPRTKSGTSLPSFSAAPSPKLKRGSGKKSSSAGSPTAPSAAP